MANLKVPKSSSSSSATQRASSCVISKVAKSTDKIHAKKLSEINHKYAKSKTTPLGVPQMKAAPSAQMNSMISDEPDLCPPPKKLPFPPKKEFSEYQLGAQSIIDLASGNELDVNGVVG